MRSRAESPPEIHRHDGVQIVDDSRPLGFFLQPTDTLHRRYEALRAYFVERQPLGAIAQRFGYRYTALRDLIYDFRAQCREDRIPPFSDRPDPGGRGATAPIHRQPARNFRPSPIVAG
jgi:hypothetical protein